MAPKFSYIYKFYNEIETAIVNHLLNRFSPGQLVPALINLPKVDNARERWSLKELLQESFLWAAVPKKRKTVQKVRMRKFGWKKYVWKPLVCKKNILTCNVCGGHHESDTLCGTCYNEVIKETKKMQEAIDEKLGISPIEEEVIVLYENENTNPEFWKGKRIVEMKKPRPSFFSKNLLQGSTQSNAKTSDVMEVLQPLEYK